MRTIADLRRVFRGSGIHRFARRPDRFVVCNIDVGWNACELCVREHRVWMTADRTWNRLPVRHRNKRLCTRCFRRVSARA